MGLVKPVEWWCGWADTLGIIAIILGGIWVLVMLVGWAPSEQTMESNERDRMDLLLSPVVNDDPEKGPGQQNSQEDDCFLPCGLSNLESQEV